MDDNKTNIKNGEKTNTNLTIKEKLKLLATLFTKNKLVLIIIICITVIIINWGIIEIITQNRLQQVNENVAKNRKFLDRSGMLQTSQYYYVTYFKPNQEKLAEKIKNSKKFDDNDFHEFMLTFSNKITEMNRHGIDNINQATCSNHAILTNNKEIYEKSGIKIKEENCIYSFSEDWDYLYNAYSGAISEEYGMWLKYLANNFDHTPEHKNYKASELKNNILFLEELLIKNPRFIAAKDVDAELSQMLYKYMQHDNTNVYNSNNQLNPEYKKSYENFLRENTESIFYMLVKDYYQILKENNFKYTPPVKEWLDTSIEKIYIDIDPGEGLNVQ